MEENEEGEITYDTNDKDTNLSTTVSSENVDNSEPILKESNDDNLDDEEIYKDSIDSHSDDPEVNEPDSSDSDKPTIDNLIKDTNNIDSSQKTDNKNVEEIVNIKDSNDIPQSEKVRPTGKVLAVLERENRAIVGFLRRSNQEQNTNLIAFLPEDKKLPKFLISKNLFPGYLKNIKKYSKTFFTLKYSEWPAHFRYPTGKELQEAGTSGDIISETNLLLRNYKIEDSDFDPQVTESIPVTLVLDDEIIKSRRDMRKTRIFTIDPSTARDLDDALSCIKLDNGNYELGVHIADVSHYVKPNTLLDKLAREKSTSIYLVHKVLPMLPRVLCENLCSLNPKEDRLSFSIVWEMTPDGNIIKEWIGKTIMHSCVKLAYSDAQKVIEDFNTGVENLRSLNPEEDPIDIANDIILMMNI